MLKGGAKVNYHLYYYFFYLFFIFYFGNEESRLKKDDYLDWPIKKHAADWNYMLTIEAM